MLKGKMIAYFTIVLMLILVAAGCSDPNTEENAPPAQDNGSPVTESADPSATGVIDHSKKYDITLFQWGPRDIHKDDAIIKHINETFNINLKVERILVLEYNKNLELKIAAGDMPDIFRTRLAALHIYSNLYEDGYLMNFKEYADKYNLQNLKAYMNRPGTEEFRENDGVFQIPTNRGQDVNMFIVRQDWLDQLKMEHPKNWDEFRLMLKAFKDNNLGGGNTVPLTVSLGYKELNDISSMWTGANLWTKVDDKWTYEYVMPEYKEFVQYISGLYQEGLIDRELFTASETQAKAKFVSGSSGLYIARSNRYAELELDTLATNSDAKLSLMIPKPQGKAGDLTKVTASYSEPIVVIKKGREEDFLARVAELVDWMHSEEGIHILNFGLEGVHYNMQDGQMVRTEEFERDLIESIGHLTAMTTDYSAAAGNMEGILKKNVPYSNETGIAPPISEISYGSAKDLIPAITKVYEEWFIEFVTGQKDIESNWDNYVQALNKAGLDKLTASIEENTKKRQQ